VGTLPTASAAVNLPRGVIKKPKPSGFFGTNLSSYLTLLCCDTVIAVGTTTSGCVCATVVDAFSLNYRVILAEEGCFDRSEASHAVSLCDMHAKYADLLPTAEILSYFNQLPLTCSICRPAAAAPHCQ
jgi:maleamate amidohydrolase